MVFLMKTIEPSLRTQSIGDADIRYLYYGGDGPVIVFMHATGFIPWLWHPIAREFAGRYQVIAPYFYEHRFVEPEKGGINWILLAEDLVRFCESLKLDRPVMVGHSLGGALSVMADALRGSVSPGMVLFEPVFLLEHFYGANPTIEQHPLAAKAVKRGNHWENAADAKCYFLSRDLFKSWDGEMVDIYVAHGLVEDEGGGLRLACTPRQEAAIFMGDTIHNPWPYIEKVRCPVLVVEGGKSDIRPFADFRLAASRFRNGAHLPVPGAGHLIPMERPEEAVRIIREFLASEVR